MKDITKTDFLKQKVLNIVIIGDSIGDGCGASSSENKWASILTLKLKKKYDCDIRITNLSVGGTGAIFGYHKLNRISDTVPCDIAIVCYGQNDFEGTFEEEYCALLRKIRLKWPGCFICSILESSQRVYTNKIKIIQKAAYEYGCTVCDTIEAFSKSGKKYEELSPDGIHVNNIGQIIYADAIFKSITEKLVRTSEKELPESKEMEIYDRYRYVPICEMQYNLRDYRITTSAERVLFNCLEAPYGAEYSIFINNKLIMNSSFKTSNTWVWERVYPLNNTDKIKNIKIIIADETDVCLLRGVILLG